MNEKLKIYDEKMQKTIHALDTELASIRAGRANPNILNKLTVEYYGTPTPIQQVANISVPEARMIQIQPWEKNKRWYCYPSGIPGTDRGTKKRTGERC